MNDELFAYQKHNKVLDTSSEYQRILPEVMREVYTIFVNNRIADYERFYANQEESEDIYKDEDNPVMIEFFKNMQADLKARREEEKWLEMDDSDDPFYDGSGESMKVSISKRIAEAKRLLPSNPEQAAELFMQLGCCHTLWALQKCILKEKYDITWYTPAELHPEIKYD